VKKIIMMILILILIGISIIFPLTASATTITAGNGNITPTTNGGPLPNRTIWMTGNPVTGTGTIDHVVTSAYSGYAMTGVTVGTFYLTPGGYYHCRDSQYLGTIVGLHTSEVSLSAASGDILGLYFASGYSTMSTTGTGNNTWATFLPGGNQIVVGQETLASSLASELSPLGFGGYGIGVAVGFPYGTAEEATSITCTSAIFNGYLQDDGNLTTTAVFKYAGGGISIGDPEIIDVGVVAKDSYFTGNATGLIPDNLYWYWITFSNSAGNFSTSTGESGGVFFMTSGDCPVSAPVVQTMAASNVDRTTARLNAALLWDGGLPCYTGFSYRVVGSGTWITSELSGIRYSVVTFSGELSNLVPDTNYEFAAYGKNGVATAGIYGEILTFTTLHVSGGIATPTPGPGIELPPWLTFPIGISGTVKTILGVIFTVVGMILIVFVIRSTGGMLAAAAYGLGMTIVFVVIGWYPLWIILLIGAIVGLITFLIVLGRK
jgi:hypothetical protein